MAGKDCAVNVIMLRQFFSRARQLYMYVWPVLFCALFSVASGGLFIAAYMYSRCTAVGHTLPDSPIQGLIHATFDWSFPAWMDMLCFTLC